jgi:hypothetical protein
MWIFPYVIVLRDIPFKKVIGPNDDLKFQRSHINFSGINDPAEIVSAVSMTPRKFRMQFLNCFTIS